MADEISHDVHIQQVEVHIFLLSLKRPQNWEPKGDSLYLKLTFSTEIENIVTLISDFGLVTSAWKRTWCSAAVPSPGCHQEGSGPCLAELVSNILTTFLIQNIPSKMNSFSGRRVGA